MGLSFRRVSFSTTTVSSRHTTRPPVQGRIGSRFITARLTAIKAARYRMFRIPIPTVGDSLPVSVISDTIPTGAGHILHAHLAGNQILQAEADHPHEINAVVPCVFQNAANRLGLGLKQHAVLVHLLAVNLIIVLLQGKILQKDLLAVPQHCQVIDAVGAAAGQHLQIAGNVDPLPVQRIEQVALLQPLGLQAAVVKNPVISSLVKPL